jgi:hypothetical protein
MKAAARAVLAVGMLRHHPRRPLPEAAPAALRRGSIEAVMTPLSARGLRELEGLLVKTL